MASSVYKETVEKGEKMIERAGTGVSERENGGRVSARDGSG